MKYFMLFISTSAWFQLTKGQCDSQVSDISIERCDGSERRGQILYIDFHKISKPCSCKVNPLFEGNLLISAQPISINTCSTEVSVGNTVKFNCPTEYVAVSLDVNDTLSIPVISQYEANKSPGEFYHCIGIQENSAGLPGKNVHVTCNENRTEASTQIPNTSTNQNETSSIKYVTEIYAIAGGILVCLVLITLAVLCSRIQKLKTQKQGSNIIIATYTPNNSAQEDAFSENIVPSFNGLISNEQCSTDFDNSSDAIQVEVRPNTRNTATEELSSDAVKYQVNLPHINMAQAPVLKQNQVNDEDLSDILEQNDIN